MKKSSRRTFVRGLAAGLLAAPFFSPLGRAVDADTRGVAKRLVVFFSPNGTVHRHLWPTSPGALRIAPGSVLEPLTRHQSDLLVLSGLDFQGASNHEGGMAAMLTGGGGAASLTAGMSLDQWVAQHVGATDVHSSLELGVQTSAWGGNVQTRMSYRGAGAFVPPDDRPLEVYRRVFGDLVGGEAEVDATLDRRGSVLDVLRADLADLRRRAPRAEQLKLDAHLAALRATEMGVVGGGTGGSCDAPALADLDPMANDNFPSVARAQMDLLVAALSCGRTKVASLQCSHTVSPTVMNWLGIGEGHHSLSHVDDGNSAGIADFVAAEQWYAEQFAYLLDRLAELPEPDGDGRMLDSTLVVWAQELGDGRLHECKDVPFVLAGNACGHFETGRFLRFDGEPHNKLLVSVCHAMGLDNPTFGDASFGTGPLAGLRA